MGDSDRIYWLWLSCAEILKAGQVQQIIEWFGSPEECFKAQADALEESGIFVRQQIDRLESCRDMNRLKYILEKLSAENIKIVNIQDDIYPEAFRMLFEPPVTIYVKGQLPSENELLISMVGARKSSPYGQQTAKMIGRGLASSGISVVSGMARGIDSASHWGAIEGGGKTYAIVGSGADRCYPADNMDLYVEIARNGGIISEFPPGSIPVAWHFPLRNRMIAAMGRGIVVVEAARRSGSLITVEQGLELGKDIFAVPGRIDDPLSEGCNDLIRQGARLITSPEDVLGEYGLSMMTQKVRQADLTMDETTVYKTLALVPRTPEDVSRMTGMKLGRVMSQLVSLEMKGMIRTLGKNYFIVCL